jgi:hypothetical protein
MNRKLAIAHRPAYYDGQLLQADDFIDEQRYHIHAQRRHATELHGVGVVRGLQVSAAGEHAVAVGPGFAVDGRGREIELPQGVQLDLSGAAPLSRLRILLSHRDDQEAEREHRHRIASWAVVSAREARDDAGDDGDGLLLATVQLDAQGRIGANAIDTAVMRRLRTMLAPGSVGIDALDDSLRRGWLRLPFRGTVMVGGPDGEGDALPPPFRIGTTEARSPSSTDKKAGNPGAGGTMAIPIPLGAVRVLRLRLAGSTNAGGIRFHLVRGGYDPATGKHLRHMLVDASIEGQPYNKLFDIADGVLDPEYHTLALWLHGLEQTTVSLVAIEFSY